MPFLHRLRALFRRDAIADEIREELAFHVEMRIEELQQRGLTREDAERQVHQRFGNVAKLRDQGYEVRRGGVMETIRQDVRHSVRLLRRKPAYAVATMATLSLGIGLIATLASVVDAAWLRPLPFVQPDRLVEVSLRFRGTPEEPWIVNPSVLDIHTLQTSSPVFDAIGGYHALEDRVILDRGEPERVMVLNATAGYFEAHGAVPVLGRTLMVDDGRAGAEAVVVLGYGFWWQRLGGDPNVIGTRLQIDNSLVTVVGVAPREFHRSAHAFRPMPAFGELANRRGTGATVLARLRPGVPIDAATAALQSAAVTLAADAQVVRTIAVDTVRPALLGLVLGVISAVYAAPLIERNLFQVRPTDPYTLAGVGALVVLAATLVAWVPARRAARIDPVTALRN